MSLRQKTISGLLWSALSQGGKQTSQFVITAILARILSPSDFGLVAMATVFTGFAMIFSELGISSALIQKQHVTEVLWSSVFWLNLGVGSLLTLFFFMVAPWIAAFYKQPALTAILQVLSLNFIFSSFTIVQQTVLTREMNFRSLMIRDITAVVVSGLVGVILALRGWGVWSLVIQSLVFTGINGLLLWILSPWRPQIIFSFKAIKDILNFSVHVTGFQIVNYFARNVDQLLIGKFLGSQALGYYSLAYKLMLLPLQNISWTISRVMFPAFSRIQDDLVKVKTNYLRLMKAASLISFPLMITLFFVAPEMVRVFWGIKWESVIVLIRIFCFCGMVQSLGTNIGSVLLSQGRADLQLKLQILGTAVVTVAVFLGLHWGIVGVALLYTIQSILWVHFTFYIVNKQIALSYGDFYKSFYKSYFIASIMFVLGIILKNTLILADLQWLVLLPAFYAGLLFIMLWVMKEIKLENGKLKIGLIQ